MTIKNSLKGVLACALLLGSGTVLANDCKYAIQKTDPNTGVQNLATKIVGVSTAMASCKYKQNEVDSFTQERLIKVDWVDMTTWASGTFNRTIGNRKDIEVAAAAEGPRCFLKLRVKLSDTTQRAPNERDLYHALYVPQGSSLEITLADESNMQLRTDHSTIEFNVNKKGNEAISKVIGCLKQAQAPETT